MVKYIPKRGDFIALTFDPQAGHEQKGTRPALVVSHTAFNKRMGFVLVCPLTNTQRKNAFHIPVTARKLTGYIEERHHAPPAERGGVTPLYRATLPARNSSDHKNT